MAEQVAPMGPEHGHDEQGGQKKIGVKRKDDLQVVNPASPSKQSKTDVSQAAPTEIFDLSNLGETVSVGNPAQPAPEEIFDLSNLSDAEVIEQEDTKGFATYEGGMSDINITAQVIRIKLDKEFKGAKGPSTVFNILVEDKTGTTNICSFGDDAVRLKALVADQTGQAFVFRKLYSKIPKDDKKQFLPGTVPYEFFFQRTSTATVVPQGSRKIQKLHHFADQLGRQEADFVVVAMSTFHNYAHADSKLPEYRGRVTDGMFYTELQLPFAPHFNTGNELYVLRATPRFKDGKVSLLISSPSDVDVITDPEPYTVTREQKVALRPLTYE
ncbi:hypothetical protein AAVH_26475 [Aphelenchoides avenae]|nr:hypothetical protein AAVH_26475 [Aphelenchus avenae]